MRRVAVFGNAGGGKSTLVRRLAQLTGLPLHVVDMIQFRPGGAAVPDHEYLAVHADLIGRDAWIIDGFGSVASAWERFAAADTLIHVDLPVLTHYRWVTKRLLEGLFASPKGWPAGSPLWASTLSSYRVVWSCHRTLTPRYRTLVAEAASIKRVHHLRSSREIRTFLETVERDQRSRGPAR